MPPGDEYAPLSSGGGGKLKLKGDKVNDGRIEKKKKKKEQKKKAAAELSANTTEGERDTTGENENSLARRGKDGSAGEGEEGKEEGRKESASGAGGEILVGKTEAEKRYEEQRRKRLQDRLKREGVKTHKERVEELNKYLSRLTEHHDMPKIGPG